MSKFALKNIEAIKGRQRFSQLIVLPNDADAEAIQNKIYNDELSNREVQDGQLDIYEKELEGKYTGSLASILNIMNRVANLQSVSQDKFKDITPSKETVKEYEFKHQDLRVYAIYAPDGKIIVFGGYKNNQKADIKKFRSLKSQYLESLKNNHNEKRSIAQKRGILGK